MSEYDCDSVLAQHAVRIPEFVLIELNIPYAFREHVRTFQDVLPHFVHVTAKQASTGIVWYAETAIVVAIRGVVGDGR